MKIFQRVQLVWVGRVLDPIFIIREIEIKLVIYKRATFIIKIYFFVIISSIYGKYTVRGKKNYSFKVHT